MRNTALLKNWKIDDVGFYRLVGTIYNDSRGLFKDGEVVVTSSLLSIDLVKNKAKTKNSDYTLEEAQ